jgi:hypothetical protein
MDCMRNSALKGAFAFAGAWRTDLVRIALNAVALPLVVVISGCAHSRRPERRVYVISEDATGITGVGGSGKRNCDAEHIQCFDICWNSAPPLTSIKRGSGKHHEYCTEECRKEYMDCLKETQALRTKAKGLVFPDMDEALEWIREHKTELAIGTVVLVAGVAFVVSTGGTGALLLVPLAL